MEVNALSLFSGCGGGALAAEGAGYHVAACIDNDQDACRTLTAAGFEAVRADTRTVDFSAYQGVDLVLGGPPCQPFSAAGLQRGEVDPRDRIPDFVRAVEQARPRVFVLENVQGLTQAKHRAYLDHVLNSFPDGYTVDYRVLNAADFGVPQTRRRLFIVGRRDGINPAWPVATHAEQPGPFQRPWVTAAAALGREDLPEWAHRRPSYTVVGSFRPEVISGPGYRGKGDGPRQNAPGSFVTTPAERAVLQGFPAGHPFAGSKASVGRQLGNACPPALLQAVITAQAAFVPATPSEFRLATRRAWGQAKGGVRVGEMLTDYTVEDLVGKDLFLAEDGLTGFAIDAGDLQGLFNIGPAGRGAAAVATALHHGARTLDALGPFLPVWYGRQGWVIDRWEDNWTPGEPPVAYMHHTGSAATRAAAA